MESVLFRKQKRCLVFEIVIVKHQNTEREDANSDTNKRIIPHLDCEQVACGSLASQKHASKRTPRDGLHDLKVLDADVTPLPCVRVERSPLLLLPPVLTPRIPRLSQLRRLLLDEALHPRTERLYCQIAQTALAEQLAQVVRTTLEELVRIAVRGGNVRHVMGDNGKLLDLKMKK